jgi:hypothetical protein
MSRIHRIRYFILFFLVATIRLSKGWEWSDLLQVSETPPFSSSDTATLTLQQVSEMRVRDIKRRLARKHGYDADELGRVLDKKELINTLAFEEHKLREADQAEFQRQLFWKAVLATILAGAALLLWPLIRHAWEVAHVNLVVYTDRKQLEAARCWELRSFQGCLGVTVMSLLDVLSLWLFSSVILSWVMTSNFFFPIPSISIHPAAIMGGQMANSPMAQYGINVGPMVLTWALRFLQGRVERWTGRAMTRAQKVQRQQQRANETADEKAARKARKAARKAAKEEAQRQHGRARAQAAPPPPPGYDNLWKQSEASEPIDSSDATTNIPVEEPTLEERREAAAAAEERLWQEESPDDPDGIFSKLDELD